MSRYPGSQPINLGAGCMYEGTIQHEAIHALGFEHEHNRYDRDRYLNLYMQNVDPGFIGILFYNLTSLNLSNN